MSSIELVLLVAGLLVLLSIVASKVSDRFGVPALLIFLTVGMLAGSDGLGGIYFDDAELARSLGVMSLAFILFSAGLDTSWASIRPVLARGLLLSTVSVVISGALVGALMVAGTDVSLGEGLLVGVVVSSTDAAAVFAVLRARSVRVLPRLRSLLELESGGNDPMAVFLTMALISLLTDQSATVPGFLMSFVLQMGVGLGVGLAMGRISKATINRIRLEHDGLYPVLSVALLVVTFGAAWSLRGSGFLAVYVAGLVLGNSAYIHKRSLTRFHDGLAWLMQIVMFITLGLLVFPSHLLTVWWAAILVAVFLMFVARPLSVFAALAWSDISWRGRLFVSWVGLRGAAPIILATFALVAGVGGERLFNIVFFVVIISVLIQGTTIPAVARRLRVEGPTFEPAVLDRESVEAGYLVEYLVPSDSRLVGGELVGASLPPSARALLIRRYDSYLVPTGRTRLRREDVVLMLVDEEAERALDAESQLVRIEGPAAVCRMPYVEPEEAGT